MTGLLLWNLVLGAALLAYAGAVAFFAARRAERERNAKSGLTPGFKGWLMGLAAAILIAPVVVIIRAALAIAYVDEAPYVAQEVVATELSGALVLLAATLMGAVLVLRRSVLFRPMFYLQCAVLLLLPVLNLAMTGEGGEAPDLLRWIVAAAVAAGCIAYVARSRRVALTFVR